MYSPLAQVKFMEEDFMLPWHDRNSQRGDYLHITFLTVWSICFYYIYYGNKAYTGKKYSSGTDVKTASSQGSNCTKLPQPSQIPYTEKPKGLSGSIQTASKEQASSCVSCQALTGRRWNRRCLFPLKMPKNKLVGRAICTAKCPTISAWPFYSKINQTRHQIRWARFTEKWH